MARIIKLLLIICVFIGVRAYAEPVNLSTLVTPQNVQFEQCTRIFKIDAESLFYLTLASVNANRFRVEEIQSKTGYVLFKAVGKSFLASVIKIDSNTSILKITPTSNVYYFEPGIVLNIFRYIELNAAERPVNLPLK